MENEITVIGRRYEGPVFINISNGRYILRKGDILLVSRQNFDYYSSESIPIGSQVRVNFCFRNLYGVYVNVTYKDKDYNIEEICLFYK